MLVRGGEFARPPAFTDLLRERRDGQPQQALIPEVEQRAPERVFERGASKRIVRGERLVAEWCGRVVRAWPFKTRAAAADRATSRASCSVGIVAIFPML